jgi:3-hydroxyisobutyrate dehydrogenase
MLLGVSMIATCEAFVLAEKLGLDPQVFFDISSKASGQNWSMTSYCPAPGPVPTAPSNRDYAPGFATAMMLKDLKLAQAAAASAGASTPMGAAAEALYALYAANGGSEKDFSGIIQMLAGRAK